VSLTLTNASVCVVLEWWPPIPFGPLIFLHFFWLLNFGSLNSAEFLLGQFSTHDNQEQVSFFASRNGDKTLSCGVLG